MITKILKQSKETREILGIRLYDGEEDFWCGYIEDFNDTIIQIRHFDRFGEDDGIIIEQLENIESVDFETNYEKTYNYLARQKNDFESISLITYFKDSENWRYEYLTDCKSKNLLVSIEFNQDYVIYGFVMDIDTDEFVIKGIGKLGEDEGMTAYKISDISAFKILDNDCRLRQELHDWRY